MNEKVDTGERRIRYLHKLVEISAQGLSNSSQISQISSLSRLVTRKFIQILYHHPHIPKFRTHIIIQSNSKLAAQRQPNFWLWYTDLAFLISQPHSKFITFEKIVGLCDRFGISGERYVPLRGTRARPVTISGSWRTWRAGPWAFLRVVTASPGRHYQKVFNKWSQTAVSAIGDGERQVVNWDVTGTGNMGSNWISYSRLKRLSPWKSVFGRFLVLSAQNIFVISKVSEPPPTPLP